RRWRCSRCCTCSWSGSPATPPPCCRIRSCSRCCCRWRCPACTTRRAAAGGCWRRWCRSWGRCCSRSCCCAGAAPTATTSTAPTRASAAATTCRWRSMNRPEAAGAIVNDVTRLNPVRVWAVATPASVEEVQDAVRRAQGPISIGGGHFSMGGQTASPGSLHLDMRGMNRVLEFRPQQRTIRVQAGIRWCDIQRFVDPHGLSVRIMQTYANFTVGGSLGVNVHGRYVGLGPLVLSVRAIRPVLADGELVEATPTENADIFHGASGGYGALGCIVEAELELAENVRVKRDHAVMPTDRYAAWFREHVRNDADAVFHNADLYPPHYRKARAVSWRRTTDAATAPE